MKKQMIRYIMTLVAAAGMIAFSGCETGEGVGEDMQDAGEGIQDAADDARD